MPTIQDIYEAVIETGIKNDPRPKDEIKYLLKEEKKSHEKLSDKEKKYYDESRLKNPYSDTRILFGNPKSKVKKMMVGIDLEAPELVLAALLNRDAKKKIDLAIAHHPEGMGFVKLADVMGLQADLYANEGVPINVSEKLIQKEMTRITQGVHSANQYRAVDAARLLDLPYMCTHTVSDNVVYTYVRSKIAKAEPRTVGDVVDLLLDEPEYQESARLGVPPICVTGSKANRAGKIVVTGFTGGTSGSSEIYESMKHAGIGTEIVMHCTKEHREMAEKHHITVIVAGHMASDSLGMNLLLDPFEKQGIDIVPVSGFIRVSRN